MQLKANRLGEMLLEAGLIDRFQLESALSMQRNLGGRIGSALVKLGYLPEETILEFLETQAKFMRVSLAELTIDREVLSLIPADRLKQLLVIPVELRQQGKEKILRVAMTDPTNLRLIDDLQFATGCRVLPLLASEEEIREALQRNLPQKSAHLAETKQTDGKDEAQRDYQLVDFGAKDYIDPRFERLLEVLEKKGILSALDVERIRFG
jgi:hypothetical protein